MLIKSIHLNNIRSYVDQKINFNNGVVVLSGDIGSGKSSILLALEFALFGIYDSGDYLLRKGQNEGSVELKLELNNEEYIIKRFLKRKAEGIRQVNGYVTVNGTKKDLTPIELKQYVINLLGYPQETLNKKSLIYRYTTYTPQEEMKHILYENPEERMSIIRKIFGIDKYQRIIENSSVFTKYLRENKREILGKISDLESKKNNLKEVNEEKELLMKRSKDIEKRLTESKLVLLDAKNNILKIEEEIKRHNELKKQKAELEVSLKHKHEQNELLKKEIMRLEVEIATLKERANPEKLESLKNKIKQGIKEEISIIEKELLSSQKQLGEIETIKNTSEKIKKQIAELNDCPLCLQSVPHSHKDKIKSTEEEKIVQAGRRLLETLNKIEEAKKRLSSKKFELQESDNAERDVSLMNMQIKNMFEKEVSINEKKDSVKLLENHLISLNQSINNIQIASLDKEYDSIRNEYEKLRIAERNLEIESAKISTEIKNNEKTELILRAEIEQKETAKKKLNEINVYEGWMQNNFSNIISLMEKHILSKIYFTFNDIFKDMFEMMIEDERITSSIDENFTPKIEQNGYETDFENLSGGEKTSISLAYRLALHKAINTMISDIKTSGLLILDEPTDGFSSEQIDKMKDLFEKLKTNQTIIVSHESKIESIADHVVKIAKQGHESLVLG